MPEPLTFDPPAALEAETQDTRQRGRLWVRSAFLVVLAALSLTRVVALPALPLLPVVALSLLLYAAIALGFVRPRRGLRTWVPALDLGLLFVLVAYSPQPNSWGALAYVWLGGRAVVSEARHPARWLVVYGLAAWSTLALAALRTPHPVDVMAGHTVALALFVGLAGAILRERMESRIDPLTRALDRRGGLIELERRLERGRPFKIAVVDLRDFKEVNDSYGHAAGDQALRIIGRRLRHALREDDAVIRYGGDEFVVVSELPALDERLAEAFVDPLKTRYGTFAVAADIGIMPWHPGLALADILAEADRRMYATKRAG